MRAFMRQHPIVSYVILAYGLSWVDWIPLALRGATVEPGGSVTHFPGLLGPALAAIIVTGLVQGRSGLADLIRRMVLVSRPSVRFAVYSLSPVAFLALAVLVAITTNRPVPAMHEFGLYSGLPALPVFMVVVLVLLFNGLGEEVGWRGFALGPLQARFGPVKGTLAVALIWAGWHAPLFWIVASYRTMGVGALIGGFGLGLCAGALVLARVLNRTGGSILAAALWHTTYNLTSATAAGRGVTAAVTTTCVMVWAAVLLIREWRRPAGKSLLLVPAAH